MESGLKNFTAYKKALELFDLVVHDLGDLAFRASNFPSLFHNRLPARILLPQISKRAMVADPERNTHSSSSSLEAQPKKRLADMRE